MPSPTIVGPNYFSAGANSSAGLPSGAQAWGGLPSSPADAPDGIYSGVHLNPTASTPNTWISQWLQTTGWQGVYSGDGAFLSAAVSWFMKTDVPDDFTYQAQLLSDGVPFGSVKTGTFSLTSTGAWTQDVGSTRVIGDWGETPSMAAANLGVQLSITNGDAIFGPTVSVDSVRLTGAFGFYDVSGGDGSVAMLYGRTTTRYIDPRRGRNRKTVLVTRRPTSHRTQPPHDHSPDELKRTFRRRLREAA